MEDYLKSLEYIISNQKAIIDELTAKLKELTTAREADRKVLAEFTQHCIKYTGITPSLEKQA